VRPPQPQDMDPLERRVWVFLVASLLAGTVGRALFPLKDPEASLQAQGTSPTVLRLDPSTAPYESLLLLPGVGPTLARRILEDRARHGPYRRPEDLQRVRGIGPRTLKRMRPYLDLRPENREHGGHDPS